MTSTAKTIQYSGKQKLHDIVTFHGSGEDGVFYQESLVPFFLMRMTVKKDNPEASFFSIYTPETQIHVPSAAALKGRGFHSQHQHNCFEFTYVLEGDMYQLVEGKRYYYPTGSCCLMNRNTLHTEERSSDYTCIFLSVSPEFVRKLMNDGKPLLFPGEQALYRNLIFEFFQQISDMVSRLQDMLSITHDNRKPVVMMDTNRLLRGLKWLNPIYHCIENHIAIRIIYRKYHAKKGSSDKSCDKVCLM